MNIRLVGSEFFHADGRPDTQPDMTKVTVAISNFANAPTEGEVFLFTHPGTA